MNFFFRVMDDLTVRLTDYALSRDLFPEDYDCFPTDISNESRPLKFMAIESINDRRFSTASDVVSFIVFFFILLYFLFFSFPGDADANTVAAAQFEFGENTGEECISNEHSTFDVGCSMFIIQRSIAAPSPLRPFALSP